MKTPLFRYIVLVMAVSLPAAPAWSLTLEQRVAALEQHVDALQLANTLLQISNSTLTREVTSLTAEASSLQTAVNAVTNNTVLKLDGVLDTDAEGDAVFRGVNVQIVNGLGNTLSNNGKGNLVVGYNESDYTFHPVCSQGPASNQSDCEAAGQFWMGSQHSGSHYLVLGLKNSYTQSSGIISGYGNASTAPFANVTGGVYNVASGEGASVSGGGGYQTDGSGQFIGGLGNTASGMYSSVAGGIMNTAIGDKSTVMGGAKNQAKAIGSSVVGGESNVAGGASSSVLGGDRNQANANNSTVTGGYNQINNVYVE
ncbi:MAG: hypothetical protein ABSB19_12435 [Methylomonas sp.]